MIRKTLFNYATGVNKKFVYNGYHHAISAVGSFSLNEKTQHMKIQPIENIGKFNVSNSVQIVLSNQLFNNKLGKFNETISKFDIDTLTITANEFASAITESQINSVGKLETIYSDFAQYVDDFLSFEEGFSSIYYMEDPVSIENREFTSTELFQLMTRKTDNIYGTYDEIFGSITIYGVNELLKNAKKMNIFGNRATNGETLSNGFLEGDIIYIPYGINITLSLELDANTLRLNEAGKKNVEKMNQKTDFDDGFMSQTTYTSMYRIQREIKIPLFIKLIKINLPVVVPLTTPIPMPIIAPTPTPTPEPEPESESAPESKPESKSTPEPEPESESASKSEPIFIENNAKESDLGHIPKTNSVPFITSEITEKTAIHKEIQATPKYMSYSEFLKSTKIISSEKHQNHIGKVHDESIKPDTPIIMENIRQNIPLPPPTPLNPNSYNKQIGKRIINITKQFIK